MLPRGSCTEDRQTAEATQKRALADDLDVGDDFTPAVDQGEERGFEGRGEPRRDVLVELLQVDVEGQRRRAKRRAFEVTGAVFGQVEVDDADCTLSLPLDAASWRLLGEECRYKARKGHQGEDARAGHAARR